jgi:hypothetical protein
VFITKEEIRNELKDEECWKALPPKEKKFFLQYCINGLDGTEAYKDVYMSNESGRTVKFPGKKANEIIAKDEVQECFEIYGDLVKETAPSKVNMQIFNLLYNQAFYSPFDFMDTQGEFLYDTVEEAKEKLGVKALAIKEITTTMHPKDPDRVVKKVIFHNRSKAVDALSKYTQFIEKENQAGSGMGQVVLTTQMPKFDPADDEVNRKRYGLE